MNDSHERPELRFVKILALKKEELGSYIGLERAIQEANPGRKGAGLDRRKLKKLVEGEDVSLSRGELLALDVYLTPLGEGLADKPLLERRWILHSLGEKNEVALLMGSYPRSKEQRNDLSRWDVRAMATLSNAIGKTHPGIQIRIEDLLFTHRRPDVSDLAACSIHLREGGPSVCSIGSPRACWISEVMLAEMFRVRPFRKSTLVPFHFIWSPKVHSYYQSAFALKAKDIRGTNPALAETITAGDAWALKIGDDILEVRRKKRKDWKAYGVVVAQRRATGAIWVVIAGLSGPATYASAIAIATNIAGTVPNAQGRDAHSYVLLALVEAYVQREPGRQGDDREVTDTNVLRREIIAS